MRCKYCGGQIISDIHPSLGFIEWRLTTPNSFGNFYLCSKSHERLGKQTGHQPEEKSNNFKLIYDILNETD